MIRPRVLAFAALTLTGLWLYSHVLVRLVSDWIVDQNYSHGFFVIPLAIYFTWLRRGRLAAATPKPSNVGLLAVAAGLGLLMVGTLGAELFLTRVSIVATLAGIVLFL